MNKMRTIWKDVVGYEGLYQIASNGKIKHLPYTFHNKSGEHLIPERECIPHKMKNGYWVVDLYKSNMRKTMLLHRLVAIAFAPNPLNLPVVNHIDNNRSNCHVENLEWCDVSYNQKWSYMTNDRRAKMNWRKGGSHHSSKAINMCDKTGRFIRRFDCIMDAERELGILNNSIVACLKGRYKTAGGYKWNYA